MPKLGYFVISPILVSTDLKYKMSKEGERGGGGGVGGGQSRKG